MRGLVVLLFISIANFGVAQNLSYQEIDSISYAHYNAKEWKELVEFGKDNPADFYYYNVRLGIANFELKRYNSAEKYLNKAIANNGTDFARMYLLDTYLYLGESRLADQTYYKLSQSARNSLEYNPKFLKSIYLEAGAKQPDTNLVNTISFGNLQFQHRLGENMEFSYSINQLKEETDFHNYISLQGHFNGLYSYKNSSFRIGAMGINSDYREQITDIDDSISQPNGFAFEDSTSRTAYSFYGTLSHRFNRLKIRGSFNYLQQYTISNSSLDIHSEDVPLFGTAVEETSDTTAMFVSLGFHFTPNFLGDRITIGADLFSPITDSVVSFIIKPTINFRISDNLWVNASYIEVNDYLFADNSSEIFYNTPNLAIKRGVATINYNFLKNFTAKLTYTRENYNFKSTDLNYNINSLFLGIKYKF